MKLKVFSKTTSSVKNNEPHVWPGAPCPFLHGPFAAQPSQRDASPAGLEKHNQ